MSKWLVWEQLPADTAGSSLPSTAKRALPNCEDCQVGLPSAMFTRVPQERKTKHFKHVLQTTQLFRPTLVCSESVLHKSATWIKSFVLYIYFANHWPVGNVLLHIVCIQYMLSAVIESISQTYRVFIGIWLYIFIADIMHVGLISLSLLYSLLLSSLLLSLLSSF